MPEEEFRAECHHCVEQQGGVGFINRLFWSFGIIDTEKGLGQELAKHHKKQQLGGGHGIFNLFKRGDKNVTGMAVVIREDESGENVFGSVNWYDDKYYTK